MIVTSIEFVEHIKPNGSCGTGYSEPDVFKVTADGTTKTVTVDIWYQPYNAIKPILGDALKRKFGEKCDNLNDAFKLYWAALPDKHKPYTMQSGVIAF